MKTSDFDYDLPEELIAQKPAAERDGCRMLVMDRATGALEDRIFRDIADYLRPGDLLIANETRVMPARLLGAKRGTGGAAEVFLLRQHGTPLENRSALWEVLVRPGKRLKPGTGAVVDFTDAAGNVALSAEIVDWAAPSSQSASTDGAQKGERIARLTTQLPSLDEALHAVGHTPLPPYIKDYSGDEELYQTVYSRRESSAAAPTAGLHFTPELIASLQERHVRWETVELEVGLDTFRIVDEDDPERHVIHTEYYTVPQRTVDAVTETRERGGRVIAVGTTSVRSLESAWDAESGVLASRDPHDARERILHARAHHGCLPACGRRALPHALLRRRDVHPLESQRPQAARALYGLSASPRTGSSRRRPHDAPLRRARPDTPGRQTEWRRGVRGGFRVRRPGPGADMRKTSAPVHTR